MPLVREAVGKLLDELRPDAVPLVDAFDVSDEILASTIGRSDGKKFKILFQIEMVILYWL